MLETLRKYWGYESFRPMQEEIISSLLEGRDTLAILPTGGGKSICFQVPALMRPGICLVVTPLVALMKDQIQNLSRRGIKALAVHSGMTAREIDITLDNAIYGEYKFLYVSPERLQSNLFRTRFQMMDVSMIVVDEAHCISQWGYDFRPDYLEIAAIRPIAGENVPVAALTATATPKVAEDIMEKLNFRKPNLIRGSFVRPNLSYQFRKAEDKLGKLLEVCNALPGSGIIYAGKRRGTEDLARFLQSQSISAECYHAGMDRAKRNDVQDAWMRGDVRIIVATNAFGMGIDKPDVRFVCHYDMPATLEGYFQEAGRAGRDGEPSWAVLLWNDSDVRRLRQITRTTFLPLDYIRDIYQKVFQYLNIPYEEGKGTSRKFVIEEFARHYRLNAATAYNAVKYIEQSGYWTLTEEMDIPSKLNFRISRDALYRVQLTNYGLDTFIKVLMRTYTGLFSGYVAIDEERIARNGHYAVDVVKERLEALARRDIVNYIPGFKASLLHLTLERLTEDNLRLPESEYRQRVERHTSHLEAMIAVAQAPDAERVPMMLSYFGEE